MTSSFREDPDRPVLIQPLINVSVNLMLIHIRQCLESQTLFALLLRILILLDDLVSGLDVRSTTFSSSDEFPRKSKFRIANDLGDFSLSVTNVFGKNELTFNLTLRKEFGLDSED
jgi:hypothetical protein